MARWKKTAIRLLAGLLAGYATRSGNAFYAQTRRDSSYTASNAQVSSSMVQ